MSKSDGGDSMRPSYDFSEGVRGTYADRCSRGRLVVVLPPDIAEKFNFAST